MGFLEGKRIILGVCGSIAAYKSAFLVREFIKAGAEVQVILTPDARQFVTPLTLSTLSKRPILDSFVKDENLGVWNNHVELGLWADFFVVAPASANTLAKMAHGQSDNLLLTTYLSARCPVFFAPAMDHDMHAHDANQHNIEILQKRGDTLIPSAVGELASGLYGEGRMAEPESIRQFIEDHFYSLSPLRGKKVLITAGPTHESIDPVRYISNYSTGKMGYALARQAVNLGADVKLVSGPVNLDCPKGVEVAYVQSAAEMFEAASHVFPDCDIAIMSAAVADFKPVNPSEEKVKKQDGGLTLQLEKTVDILHTLGQKKTKQFLVGFALETNNEEKNAKEKLIRKNCDLMVLNSLRDDGAGFGHDTNQVTIYGHNKTITFGLKSKDEVAKDIFDFIMSEIL